MGAIKDLVDLVTKLSDSVQDRKFAAELREIQRMIGGILSEHAELHESRIALMTDNEKLKKKIPSLEARISELDKENSELRDPPHTAPPTDEQISIMRLLTHPYERVYASEISKKLSIPLPMLDYQCDLLRRAGFISVYSSDRVHQFTLTKKGRDFLFERKMLV